MPMGRGTYGSKRGRPSKPKSKPPATVKPKNLKPKYNAIFNAVNPKSKKPKTKPKMLKSPTTRRR